MHIIFMMLFVIVLSNQLVCSSSDPKITLLDQGKDYWRGYYKSDDLSYDISLIEKFYKAKIPAYDTKNEQFLGNQETLLDVESYRKVQDIFAGNINQDTKYPQLQKEYDERNPENVRTGFSLRWVMQEYNKTEENNTSAQSTSQEKEKSLAQTQLQKNIESWFGK